MSKFISLRILASLSRSKKTGGLSSVTPRTPPASDVTSEPSREEPTSSSRISVNRVRVD